MRIRDNRLAGEHEYVRKGCSIAHGLKPDAETSELEFGHPLRPTAIMITLFEFKTCPCAQSLSHSSHPESPPLARIGFPNHEQTSRLQTFGNPVQQRKLILSVNVEQYIQQNHGTANRQGELKHVSLFYSGDVPQRFTGNPCIRRPDFDAPQSHTRTIQIACLPSCCQQAQQDASTAANVQHNPLFRHPGGVSHEIGIDRIMQEFATDESSGKTPDGAIAFECLLRQLPEGVNLMLFIHDKNDAMSGISLPCSLCHRIVKISSPVTASENPVLMSQQDSLQIKTRAQFLENESIPAAGRYVFAYTITILNTGSRAARLLERHWLITDGHGKIQEVRGEGVVGETPHLEPGEGFRYTSAAMIETPVGIMQGEYRMVSDDGDFFDAEIPPFTLAVPRALH